MGRRILKKLVRYGAVQLAVLAAVLRLLDPYICRMLNKAFGSYVPHAGGIYPEMAVHLSLLAAWCIFLFVRLRSARYAERTGGRNFGTDHGKYKRTYGELVDYFEDADPHVLDPEMFSEESWKEADGIMMGTAGKRLVRLPSDAEANIFVAGAPGSRKTTGIAIPTCARHGGSVLAVDIKGDIYNFCSKQRRIMRFCPDLKGADGKDAALAHSSHFDPFAGLDRMNETERKLYLGNMALTLIPDEGGSDGNYFPSRGRKLFLGIVHYLLYLKPDISFPEVLHAILHKETPAGIKTDHFPEDVFEWVTEISESGCTAAIEQVSSLYGNNEKNVSGAYDCLVTSLTPFSNAILDVLLDGKGECISVEALEEGYDVYLQISQENLEVYAPLFTMILSAFMSGFTKRADTSTGAKNRPVLILMDEFPQLTFSYKMINSALSTLRSKSVQCMLIAQSIAQLSNKYQNDGWRALLGNCTYQLILKSNEEMTQKHFSALFGTRKVLKISNSDASSKDRTTGRTVQEMREPVFQPEDFADLTDMLCICFDGKRIKAKKIICYE